MRNIIGVIGAAVLFTGCATNSHLSSHSHQHGPNCGHEAIVHEGHTDYLHDGHLHSAHEGHLHDHAIPVSAANPNNCAPGHGCAQHQTGHKHSEKCGHPRVPHGDHTDYLVGGHLHHAHQAHCDDHGFLTSAS